MNEEVCKRAALHSYRSLSASQRVLLSIEDLYQIAALHSLEKPISTSDAYAYTACCNAIRDKIRELSAKKRTAVPVVAEAAPSHEGVLSSRQQVRLFLLNASEELQRALREPCEYSRDRNVKRRLSREVLRLKEAFPVSVQDFRTAGLC